jgi:hypothetical protein
MATMAEGPPSGKRPGRASARLVAAAESALPSLQHSEPPGSLLTAYARVWAVQQALILAFTGLASRWSQAQALLVAAAALSGAPGAVACALAVRIVDCLRIFPHAWESHYWCAQTDAALLLALLIEAALGPRATPADKASAEPRESGGERALREAAATVRWQMALFYASAAFWKLNSSFLDARYSCSSIYMAQLLAGYLPPSVAASAPAVALVQHAPLAVVAGESLVGAALLLAAFKNGGDASGGLVGRAATRVGVSLALLLHLGIALTPPPNNVGAFSVLMAARLFLFAPARLLGGTALLAQARMVSHK